LISSRGEIIVRASPNGDVGRVSITESRQLAQECTYRFLAAARREAALSVGSEAAFADLPAAGSVPEREPTTAEVGA
jgi:hypothetical protein